MENLRDSVSLRHPRAVDLVAHFGISRNPEKLKGTRQWCNRQKNREKSELSSWEWDKSINPVLSGSDEISDPPQSFTTFLVLIFYPTQSLCCLGSISRLYPIPWEVQNLLKPGVTPRSLLLNQPSCPKCAEAEDAKSPRTSMSWGSPEPQRMWNNFSQIAWQEARLVSDGNLH